MEPDNEGTTRPTPAGDSLCRSVDALGWHDALSATWVCSVQTTLAPPGGSGVPWYDLSGVTLHFE